jgi:hypothetical protein
MSEPLIFEKVTIHCYRIFDIAEEIRLEQAQRVLSEDTRRLKLTREGSQYLQLPNPPLTVELGKRSLALRHGAVNVDAVARLFDHGAASIIVKVPQTSGIGIEDLIGIADELYDSAALDALSLELVNQVRRAVASAVEGEHLWSQSESYTVIFAEQVRGKPSGPELLKHSDMLARLLLGEVDTHPLSERQRHEVTQHAFSYRQEDLCIVDWNSAFVYEPTGSLDIPDILEIANSQLLELRYYDDVLDGHIKRLYDEFGRRRGAWYRIVRSPYRALARSTLVTLLEMSEFIERLENSLKIIADFYLARVYEASVRRLRIPAWQQSVTRKHQMLAHVYSLLKGEVDTDRSLTLEATIVLLIVSEMIIAFANLAK